MQIEGRCGCSWSHVEPGVTPDREEELESFVRELVADHANALGHAPTFVRLAEEFYEIRQEAPTG